jgi:internalin A
MDITSVAKPAKPRRRWVRFSLRTSLLGLTVLCVCLALTVNAARRQREAVAAILKAGGSIKFDCQCVPQPRPWNPDQVSWHNEPQPHRPLWLSKLLGDEYFHDVLQVIFQENVIPEADFEQLAKLPKVRWLYLIGRPVNPGGGSGFTGGVKMETNEPRRQRLVQDSDLAVIQKLTQLQTLGIYPAAIEGPGLAYLENLRRLKHLLLFQTPLGNAGMEHIGRMTWLTTLTLNDTRITDAGLLQLQNLTELKDIDVSNTRITGEGFKNLNRLRNLDSLELQGTDFTDAGLANLQDLPKLTRLDLSNTRITDDGLKNLANLTNLQLLALDGTAISDAGLKQLSGLHKLWTLRLNHTRINGDGLGALQSLPTLESIGLDSSELTDAGLANLGPITKLKSVNVQGTHVTSDGKRRLKQSLPTTNIFGP